MNISEIDSNFKIETNLSEKDIVWQDAGGDSFVKYGVVKSDEDYLRMPRTVAKTVNEGVAGLCDNTAGVRIRFSTDSPYIAIKAVFPYLCRFPHMPLSGTGGFDLYKEAGGQQSFVGAYIPPIDGENGFDGIVYTQNSTGKSVNYILNFPTYNPVTKLYIGIKAGSRTETPDKYINKNPWSSTVLPLRRADVPQDREIFIRIFCRERLIWFIYVWDFREMPRARRK